MKLLHYWFTYPQAFTLLALLPALGVLGLFARRHRRRVLAELGSRPLLYGLAAAGRARRLLGGVCLVGGLLFLIDGTAGPRWGRDWSQPTVPGRDLVVVLDLSRSMLARDVLPDRLELARRAAADLSRTIEQRGGHRLGLVAFAAQARLVCPLTHDYAHFRTALEALDAADPPFDPAPSDPATKSGTRIGAGLRAAVEAHDPRFEGHQDILLLSDGHDPARDDEWREGLADALARHIPVHTVGIGNPDTDSPIPLTRAGAETVLKHGREVVQTRLHERPLREIAELSGGTYTPARTRDLALGELYRQRIEPRPGHEMDEDLLPLYRLRYAWFLVPAWGLLALEMLIGPRARRQGGAGELP